MIASSLSTLYSRTRCRGLLTELVVSCGHGDKAAMGHLIDLLYAPVASALAHDEPGAPSEVLVTEFFLEVWRCSPRFRQTQCPVTWIEQQLDCYRAQVCQIATIG